MPLWAHPESTIQSHCSPTDVAYTGINTAFTELGGGWVGSNWFQNPSLDVFINVQHVTHQYE